MKILQLIDPRMDNFSYVLYDDSKEAVIIDPSFDSKKITDAISENNLKPKFIILTHEHFDHTHSASKLKEEINVKIVADEVYSDSDIKVGGGDEIKFGESVIKIISTPGHSPGSICLLIDGNLFTGDTVFVGGCGRTDLEGSDPEEMRKSIEKIKELPDDTVIYPGHDYGGTKTTTVGKEKENNRFFK
ncbi:MBL fold metallo-hydrolase [Nanoarchaeota archaeon]